MMNYKVISALCALVFIVCLFVYIYVDSLNDKISDLNVELSEKNKTIDSLTKNIDDLNNQINSLNNTITITSDYIEEIAEIRSEEDIIKTAIYEEVLNDETDEIKNWLSERLPDNLKRALLKNSNNLLCE